MDLHKDMSKDDKSLFTVNLPKRWQINAHQGILDKSLSKDVLASP